MLKRTTMREDYLLIAKLNPLLEKYLLPHGPGDNGEPLWQYRQGASDATVAAELGVEVTRVIRLRKALYGALVRGGAAPNYGQKKPVASDLRALEQKIDRLTDAVNALVALWTPKTDAKYVPSNSVTTHSAVTTNGASE